MFISTNDWVPWGGSEILWSEAAKLLKKKKFDVSVFAKKWPDLPHAISELGEIGCKIGFRENRFDKELKNWHHFVNNRFSGLNIRLFYQMDLFEAFIKDNLPKILVLSLGNNIEGRPWIELARKLEIPYILLVQLVQEGNILPDSDTDRIKSYYIHATKIFFVSHQNKQIMQRYCTDELLNAEIIMNPYPTETSTEWPENKDSFNLAFIASLSPNHKGHDLLFEVLSYKKWQIRPLHINLYGDGPNSKYTRQLADFYGLKNLTFHGHVRDKNEIWKNNHGLILPSRMEGMSLALLEAVAFERVAITTNVGGAHEIIKDNETGFIADFPSVESIDETLERAWKKRENWQSMGRKLKDTFEQKYPFDPVENFCDRLISLLS